MITARFLTKELAKKVHAAVGSPTYVYDQKTLEDNAKKVLSFPNAFGLTPRFAMKSSPNANILRMFDQLGLHIDASSGYEVKRAMHAGIAANKISLSTQQLPSYAADLLNQGVHINACSLNQIDRIGKDYPNAEIGVRFNPGLGSGGTSKTNVGGPSSSFGIWHEDLPKVKELVEKYQLKVIRIHTHIGSGSDPAVWQKVSSMSLDLVRQFPDVHTLNLGGGYKVGRMPTEKSTDLQQVGAPVSEAFVKFKEETGRTLQLEIEPGTFLMANACSILTKVQDMAYTGSNGYHFIKADTGMTEILRPSLYAAQHPVIVYPEVETGKTKQYVVVGHCCESGDLITPLPDDPEGIGTRELAECQIGDLMVIDGAGAYCSAMSTKNYNSFPEATEVMLMKNGEIKTIRKRQELEDIFKNEVLIEL
jgi:diaminopimelate decarboxylase